MSRPESCYIFGAGDLYVDSLAPVPGSLVIAADGGLYHAKHLGLVPDECLGDFDSAVRAEAPPDSLVYPTKKDYTDMHLAVMRGIERGCKVFEIYGALGGERVDHSIANLQMLAHFAQKGYTLRLHGKKQIITAASAMDAPVSVSFEADSCGYLSLFATGGRVEGLTLTGLKYTLNNACISDTFPLCVSNEFIGLSAQVSFKSGTLLLVFSEDVRYRVEGEAV